MAILKSVEYASAQQARIINMSFAGPADPALSRELAAAKAKGAVLIAASGNFGPKSPPQYPAADPNVIAVSATDADDKMFRASNIGPHIAVAAPGVDILLPSPGNDYRLISGTSFSAAYVSGVAALVLQRAPGLTPDAVRKILEQTAKDLGPAGKDPEFGAGLVDAYQAIMAVQANAARRVGAGSAAALTAGRGAVALHHRACDAKGRASSRPFCFCAASLQRAAPVTFRTVRAGGSASVEPFSAGSDQ